MQAQIDKTQQTAEYKCKSEKKTYKLTQSTVKKQYIK
jgi:hypothetical protein